jgi:hypothetical protein
VYLLKINNSDEMHCRIAIYLLYKICGGYNNFTSEIRINEHVL